MLYFDGNKKQHKNEHKEYVFEVGITCFQTSAMPLTICILLNLVVTIFLSAKFRLRMPNLKGCDKDTRKCVLLTSIWNTICIL